MRRIFILLALRFANAVNTTYNGTVTCPHDALYTSLVDHGIDFCSSVLEAGHCGGGYWTPTQFASLNQTKVALYCECLITRSHSNTTMTTTGSGNWTIGDATATTLDSDPGTSDQATTETGGSPAGRPGRPGNPSEPASSFTSATWTGPGNWTIGGPTATTVSASSGTTDQPSTETGNPPAGRPRPSESSGAASASGTLASTTWGGGEESSSGLSRSAMGGTTTFGGWNSSMSASRGSGIISRPVTRMGTGIGGTGTGTGTGVPATSGNETSAISRTSLSRGSSETDGEVSATGTRTGGAVASGSNTATGSNVTSRSISDPISGTLTVAPTQRRPTAFPNGASSATTNSTSPTVSEIPVANFTRVTRTAYISQETCYSLPRDPENDPTRRALLHNSKLRELNATIPLPYIESVDFESGGIDPLYLTVRDTEEGTHYLDISNKSQIAIADGFGYSMLLDTHGIHFSTNSCTYGVHITIRNLYRQLASLAGVDCSVGGRHKRMDDMEFRQVLNLRDQCGDPITRSLRPYPQLFVGDTTCTNTDVDDLIGHWEFDCTYPGSQSGSMKCQWAIKNDVVDFLLRDPFGGSCPDLSTVITTLSETGRDFMNAESLREELYNQGLDGYARAEADQAVTAYEDLWRVLQESFIKNKTEAAGNDCALERYINLYNNYRNFEDDICEDLHAGEIPLPLTLTAGSTTIPPITTLNWAPDYPRTYNLTVQDPSKIACCADGKVADTSGNTCAYPADAIIGGTGCLCGRTADGRSVGFEVTECDNYVASCESDGECREKGYAGFVCLVGTCCEEGVCVDPYACSQNGTQLVKV